MLFDIFARLQQFWWWMWARLYGFVGWEPDVCEIRSVAASRDAADWIESGFYQICVILELNDQVGNRLKEVFVANQIFFERHGVEQEYLLVLSRMVSLAVVEYRRYISAPFQTQMKLADILIVMIGRSLSLQAVHRHQLEPHRALRQWDRQLRECGVAVERQHMEALSLMVAGGLPTYSRRPTPRLAEFCAYLQDLERHISS